MRMLPMILFFLAADLIVRWVFRIRDAKAGELADEMKTVTSSYGGTSASGS